VTLIVGYMKRYDPGYEYAQWILQSKEAVRLIRVHDLTGRGPLAPQEIYSLHRATDLAMRSARGFRPKPVNAWRWTSAVMIRRSFKHMG
jgi:hypothetical protein